MSLHLSKCHIVGNHMPRLNYNKKNYHITISSIYGRDWMGKKILKWFNITLNIDKT